MLKILQSENLRAPSSRNESGAKLRNEARSTSTEKVLRGEETGDKDVMTWPNRRPEYANLSCNGRVIGANGSVALFPQINFVTA